MDVERGKRIRTRRLVTEKVSYQMGPRKLDFPVAVRPVP
jgi:hypothetical protein